MSKLTPILVHVLADLETTVEAKVKTASAASAVTGFLVTLLGSLPVFHGAPLPSVITGAIGALVIGGFTFLAGWLTHHTPRGAEVGTTQPAVPVAPLVKPAP